MKRTFLLITALSLSIIASAQLEIRPFVGANFSDVSNGPDGANTKAKLGGQVGASLMIGNQFYVQPGIAYFNRNTEYSNLTNVENSEMYSADQKIEGIYIPLMVGFRFVDVTDTPAINGRIFAGPSLLFLTKKEFVLGDGEDDVDWNDTNWGASVGVGLDVSVFFLDAGYEFGITKTVGGLVDQASTYDGFRSNTFFVNAGVRLTLAR